MLRFRRASGFLLFIRPQGRVGVFLYLFAALPSPADNRKRCTAYTEGQISAI
nr:MAG TPA: hypothetical protein [Caudoviricetes sp.]